MSKWIKVTDALPKDGQESAIRKRYQVIYTDLEYGYTSMSIIAHHVRKRGTSVLEVDGGCC